MNFYIDNVSSVLGVAVHILALAVIIRARYQNQCVVEWLKTPNVNFLFLATGLFSLLVLLGVILDSAFNDGYLSNIEMFGIEFSKLSLQGYVVLIWVGAIVLFRLLDAALLKHDRPK